MKKNVSILRMRLFILQLFLFFSIILEIYSKTYKYYSYREIMTIFKNLSQSCPYIKIDTSQRRYNLPHPGYCVGEPCETLIVYMTDFNTMTIDRPQIYLSGLLHGDEVIGATTLTELALYFCSEKDLDSNTKWVHELLRRRLFIFTPFTNSYGFAHEMREEYILHNNNKTGTFDPNRDFPYFKGGFESTKDCMQTVAARTVNELFREYMFIQAITFHGGLNAIGYGWGNYIHSNGRASKPCPDCTAGKTIGQIIQRYSSSQNKNGINDYFLGDMVEMSYPIDGGMEDWAYSASWENDTTPEKPIKYCTPDTYGGYPKEKTVYEGNSNRCLIYIVETSMHKKPPESQLGTDTNLFDKAGKHYGHISRNIRLSISAADLIAPYIRIDKLNKPENFQNNSTISTSFIYSYSYTPFGCKSIKNLQLNTIIFNNFNFDQNSTLTLREFLKRLVLENHGQNKYKDKSELLEFYRTQRTFFDLQDIKNASCYWEKENKDIENYKVIIEHEKYFETPFEINSKKSWKKDEKMKGLISFITGDSADWNWANVKNPEPNTSPQSHLIQSRLNSDYLAENENYRILSTKKFASNLVLLLENGNFMELDDIHAFTLGKGDLNIQANIISKGKSEEYFIKSEVSIQKTKSLNTENDTYTSKWNFNLKLNFQIYRGKSESVREFVNIIPSSFDLPGSNKTREVDLELIIKGDNNKIIYLFLKNHTCVLYEITDKIVDPHDFYLTCSISAENLSHLFKFMNLNMDLNINFIKHHLIDSLIKVDLNLDNKKNALIGVFHTQSKNFNGKYFYTDSAVCLSHLVPNKIINEMYDSVLKLKNISGEFDDYDCNGNKNDCQRPLPFQILIKKITNFKLNISILFYEDLDANVYSNSDLYSNIFGLALLFPDGQILQFNNEELKNASSKILTIKNLNFIGNSIIVYQYNSKEKYLNFDTNFFKLQNNTSKLTSCAISERLQISELNQENFNHLYSQLLYYTEEDKSVFYIVLGFSFGIFIALLSFIYIIYYMYKKFKSNYSSIPATSQDESSSVNNQREMRSIRSATIPTV